MSTSILPGERPDRLEEECAVFGVFAPGEDVARMTCFGLQALQHRGQESAGIAVGDGATVMVSKDLGLVTQVFDEASLAALEGFVAVGHARYSTSGGAASWEAAQPHISAIDDVLIALAHNGTLVNTNALRAHLVDEGVQFRSGTDSEVAAKAIGRVTQETHHLRNGIRRAMEELSGAYAMVLASPDSLYAFRDPNGIRPLCIGELPDGRGWAVSSETCGLDIVGAQYVRDVEPGEIVRFNRDGMHAEQGVAARKSAACIFEYVYFARPDSVIDFPIIPVIKTANALKALPTTTNINPISDMATSPAMLINRDGKPSLIAASKRSSSTKAIVLVSDPPQYNCPAPTSVAAEKATRKRLERTILNK